MSSSSLRGQSFGGFGYRNKKDLHDLHNMFSVDSSSRPLAPNDQQEIFNDSKLEFLDKQTSSLENSYKNYLTISVILNVFTILCTIGLAGVWFYWLSQFNSDNFVCYELKSYIIWVIVIYMIGIFSQVFGIISGWARLASGFLINQAMLVIITVLRIVLDIETLNGANEYLDGCTQVTAGSSFQYYIYATVCYCILLAVLFSCNLMLMHSLRKVNKAKRLQFEYITKNERYV